MAKQENKFKKLDANGNDLPEIIGKGIDLDQVKKVKEARLNDDYIRFRCTSDEKAAFKHTVEKVDGFNESEILRALINAFSNGKIKMKK